MAILIGLLLAMATSAGAEGSEEQSTRLHAMVAASDTAGLRRALEADPELANAHDKEGGTLIMHAAYLRDLEVVRLLAERGADVRAADRSGVTALHFAASAGGRPVCELLLDQGAPIDARTRNGFTPLDRAAEQGAVDVLDLLIARGANPNGGVRDWSPLRLVARHGLRNMVERMISAGARVDARDVNGETALFWVAFGGVTKRDEVVMAHLAKQEPALYSQGDFAGVAEVLIRQGSDVAATANHGQTALHAAAESGRADVAEVLLAHGAPVGARDREGETPLHTAALHAQTGCARLLLEHGAPVDAVDARQWTPLLMTVMGWEPAVRDSQRAAIVLVLAEHGADLDRRAPGSGWGLFRSDPYTALEAAAGHGYPRVVSALLGAGADPNAGKKHGLTALQAAERRGHAAIADTLRAHGAVR